MKSTFSFIHKVLYVTASRKISLVLIALGFVLTSLSEALGLGLIGPFILFASKPERVTKIGQVNWAYDFLGFSSPSNFVAFFGLLIIIFFYLKSLLTWSIQSKIFRFSYEQEARLVKRLLHNYFLVPYAYHLSKDSSSIVHSVTGDAKKLSLGVFVPLLTVVSNIFIISALSLLLLVSSFWITVTTLFTLLPVLVLFNSLKGRIRYWGEEVSKASQTTGKLVYQALGGIKEVKLIGCDNYFEDLVSAQVSRYVKASSDFFSFQIAPRMIMECLFISLIIGFASVTLVYQGTIESLVSTLGLFGLVAVRLIPAFSNLVNALNVLRNSSFVVDKVYIELRDLENYISSSAQDKLYKSGENFRGGTLQAEEMPLDFQKLIHLNNVSYSYPNSHKLALNSIDLVIKKGESVAFIGKSGAGKSTLVDVLLGLLCPKDGDILLDKTSIYQNLRSWQSLIGYVPQSIYLIDETLEKNIAFGVPDEIIDHQRVFEVIRAAQLEDVVNGLPNGLQTRVGERGVRLSGGQRQRVGIARALYHGKDILILDEATSALDGETEALITDSINFLSHAKTIIIIAHRLSTIKNCDRIYRLSQGQIVQSGSYLEVVGQEALEKSTS